MSGSLSDVSGKRFHFSKLSLHMQWIGAQPVNESCQVLTVSASVKLTETSRS